MSYYLVIAKRTNIDERQFGPDYISTNPKWGVQATIGPREEGKFPTIQAAEEAIEVAKEVFGRMYEYTIVPTSDEGDILC